MEKTWRWFGKKDKITLDMLRQIGVEGIVTALHDVPNGEIWTEEAINDLKAYIESYGLRWSVVESLPVCEAIKYAGPEREQLIENYKISLANLGKCGWINKDTGQVKPEGFRPDESRYQEYAFSGIHVLSPAIFRLLDVPCWEGKFSIMDFYLATCRQVEFSGYLVEDLRLIDIGKPETLAKAEGFCTGTLHSDA